MQRLAGRPRLAHLGRAEFDPAENDLAAKLPPRVHSRAHMRADGVALDCMEVMSVCTQQQQ